MQKQLWLLLFTLFAFASCEHHESPATQQKVNPLIGDLSYISTYGELPNEQTNELDRVRTHLRFVEGLLRQQDVAHMSTEMQQKRTTLLDHLRDYWQNGVFPGNYDYAEQRKPCFIDQKGNICAVGYLVEQSVDRNAAEHINSEWQYADIADMETPDLEKWIASSGFSRNEVAMIQPTYGPTPPDPSWEGVRAGYRVASGLAGG
ncbi:MAG: hypothetical protein AAF570_16130, partial [Bacteroidota bacterium]